MKLSDSELVLQAKQGSESAFEELVYRYDRSVLSIALKYVRSEVEAKDIYQEVFIRVYRGLKKFEMRSEFSTWLFRITTNVCLSHKSRSKENLNVSLNNTIDDENEFELADEKFNTNEMIDSVDINDLVNAALETLNPKQKMTFVLKHYEGYKIREIAEMMNCKEGTIKKYLFDAIRNLRKKLKPVYDSVKTI